MDPVVTSDERILHLKKQLSDILADLDGALALHDFRVVFGPTHTNLIFDIVIPYEFRMSDSETVRTLQERTSQILGENYFCVIQVDKA